MSEKIKAIRGIKGKSKEVIEWLKEQGATEITAYDYELSDFIYAVNPYGKVDCFDDRSSYLFDVVELPEPKIEYTFKPFDKVLVRDKKRCPWRCDLFSHMSSSSSRYLYYCVSKTCWALCIPYEGNEDKVGKATD